MKEVVRAACPGCQRPLTVPADWIGRTVRCKHCGRAMVVRPAAVPMASPAAGPAPTWEPLPEYSPPADGSPPPGPDAPRGKYVSAFDAGDRYRGRGQYR